MFFDGEAGSIRFRYTWPVVSGALMAALFFTRNAKIWISDVLVPTFLAEACIFPMVYVTVPLSFFVNFLSLWMIGFLQFVLPVAVAHAYIFVLSRFGLAPHWRNISWLERYFLYGIFIAAEALHLFGYWIKNEWYYTVI